MLVFDNVCIKIRKPLHSVYVFSCSANVEGQPCAYLAYVSPGPIDYDVNNMQLTLSEAINHIGSFSKLGHFVLFFMNGPVDAGRSEEIEKSLTELCLGKDYVKDLFSHTGYIIWPADPYHIDPLHDTCLHLTTGILHINWRLNIKSSNILLPGTNMLTLTSVADNALVTFDADGNLYIAQNEANLWVNFVRKGTVTTVMTDFSLVLTLTADPNLFTLSGSGQTTPGFFTIPMGFAYTLIPSKSLETSEGLVPATLYYPLWEPDALCEIGDTVTFTFNPNAGSGSLTHIAATGASYNSGFRDLFGRSIDLVPAINDTARYTLYNTLEGGYYFAPNCPFVPSYESYDLAKPIQLVCGLSGNEVLNIPPNAWLFFQDSQPSEINMIASATGNGSPSFRPGNAPGLYQTSQFVLDPIGGIFDYAVQSQQAPLFSIPTSGFIWDLQEIGSITLNPEQITKTVPLLPYGAVSAMETGFGSSANGFASLESAYLAPLRNTIFSTYGGVAFINNVAAVTPQGINVTTSADGSSITLSVGATISTPAISLSGEETTGWGLAIFEAITTPQTFIVVSTQPAESGNGVIANIGMDGWEFDISLPTTAPPDFSQPIVILKAGGSTLAQMAATPANWCSGGLFNNNGSFDPFQTILSAYITARINDARTLYNNGQGVAAYGDLVALADDPGWNGFLIFNAPVNSAGCSASVQDLLIGINPQAGPLCANYLGITAAQMQSEGGNCSFFGLVDYLLPGATLQDAASGNPGFIVSTTKYDLRLTYLRALFRNAQMVSFNSAAQLVLGTLFDETVIPCSLDGTQAAGTNTIPLLGTTQIGADGTNQYAFSAPPNTSGTFYLDSTAVNSVTISDVTTTSAPNQIMFTFSGLISMRNNNALDVLSYQAIQYRGLSVTLSYDNIFYPPVISFTSGGPPVMLTAGEAVLTGTDAPTGTKVNLYRPNSLAGQMPFQFTQLLCGSVINKMPADMGFLPVKVPTGLTAATLAANWYGLVLTLGLGNNGASASNGLISAELLLAWAPGGNTDGSVALTPFFAFASADGQPLELEIEGVIKLGARSVALDATPVQDTGGNNYSQFVLLLHGLGLTVLSTTLPAGGGLTIYLSGYGDQSGNRALGWFGGLGQYEEVPVT